MSELALVLPVALARGKDDSSALLVTLLDVAGSFYRRAGARALLSEDGTVLGSISWGCVERDLVQRGFWLTESAPAVRVSYEFDGDTESLGARAGCEATVRLLIERSDAPGRAALRAALVAMQRGESGTLATVIGSQHSSYPLGTRWYVPDASEADPNAFPERWVRALGATSLPRCVDLTLDDQPLEIFVERVQPSPQLVVCGSGSDALPLVKLAGVLGWGVTLFAPAFRPLETQRFAPFAELQAGGPGLLRELARTQGRAAFVVMNHDIERDLVCLRALLGAGRAYVGVLGSRKRCKRLLDALAQTSSQPLGASANLHAPAGLQIGAETPAEVALSIVSDVQRFWSLSSGAPLRSETGPIHRVDSPLGVA